MGGVELGIAWKGAECAAEWARTGGICCSGLGLCRVPAWAAWRWSEVGWCSGMGVPAAWVCVYSGALGVYTGVPAGGVCTLVRVGGWRARVRVEVVDEDHLDELAVVGGLRPIDDVVPPPRSWSSASADVEIVVPADGPREAIDRALERARQGLGRA